MIVYGLICLMMFPQHFEDDFVNLRRTGYYGNCPDFEVTIESSGNVVFVSECYVDSIGRREYRVNRDSVRYLFKLIRQLEFFSLPGDIVGELDLPKRVTDHPSRYITVKVGNKTKTVQDDWGVFPRIVELERTINRIANIARFIDRK
jgi:hypothetical protein